MGIILPGIQIVPQGLRRYEDSPDWKDPETAEECRRWYSKKLIGSAVHGFQEADARVMIPYVIALAIRESELSNPKFQLFVLYAYNGQPATAGTVAGKFWRKWNRRDKNIPDSEPWPDLDEASPGEVIDDQIFDELRRDAMHESRVSEYRCFPANSPDPWLWTTTNFDMQRIILSRLLREGPTPTTGMADLLHPHAHNIERELEA